MKRVLRTVLILSLLAFTRAGLLQVEPRPVQADFHAPEISTDLVFQCQPDGSLITGFGWHSTGQGLQWFDLSVFDNGFAPGTYAVAGPLESSQSGLMWQGLQPATWYFTRINTLSPDGWIASNTMYFYTPDDCRPEVAFQPATSTPEGCLDPFSRSISGCVWTTQPDYGAYAIGDMVNYCYAVSRPTDVRIVVTKPDRTSLVVIDGFVSTGACLGPFEANTPRGLRWVRMYGGAGADLLSETHFFVY